jgi:hypothetical protein
LLALVINDYVLRRHSIGLHLATYVIGQVRKLAQARSFSLTQSISQSLPLLIGVEGIIGFLDLFVPLTGRLGADAPVDFIIATLVGAVGYAAVPMVSTATLVEGS